jgi:hypothetical protein
MINTMIFRGKHLSDAVDYVTKVLQECFESEDMFFDVRMHLSSKLIIDFGKKTEGIFETITFDCMIRVDDSVFCYLSDKDFERIDSLVEPVKNAILKLLQFNN